MKVFDPKKELNTDKGGLPLEFHLKVIERSNTKTDKNIIILNGKTLDPAKSQKRHNHSPDGFGWIAGNSGLAQTSLAICLELYGPALGHKLYQNFRLKVIGHICKDPAFEDYVSLIDFTIDHLFLYNRYTVQFSATFGEEEKEETHTTKKLKTTLWIMSTDLEGHDKKDYLLWAADAFVSEFGNYKNYIVCDPNKPVKITTP